MLNIRFHLLFVSLLAGAGAALFRLLAPRLRRRFASRALCAVWLALALWLVLPVHVTAKQAPVQIEVPAAVSERLNQPASGLLVVPAPASPTAPIAPAVPEAPGSADASAQAESVAPQNSAAAQSVSAPKSPAPPAAPTLTLGQWLALAWLVGAVAAAVYPLAAYLWWRRGVRRWDFPADGELAGCNAHAAASVGCRPLPIYRNANTETPMLAGFVHPVVRVPAGFAPPAVEDDPQTSTAFWVLRHEYTHRKRHDLAKKLLLQAAVCLHWFNPLVWMLRAVAQQELEYACDEAVLAGATAAQRGVYGSALLIAAGGRRRYGMAFSFGGGKAGVKRRLANLFLQNKRRGAAMALACVTAVGLCAGLVACERTPASLTPQQRLEEEDTALAKTFLEWFFRCEPVEQDGKNRCWRLMISSADPVETMNRLYYNEIAFLMTEDGLTALRRSSGPLPYEKELVFAGYSTTFEGADLTPPDWTAEKAPWESDCYEFTVHLTIIQRSLAQDTGESAALPAHQATVSGQLLFEGEEGARRINGFHLGEQEGWLPEDALRSDALAALEAAEEALDAAETGSTLDTAGAGSAFDAAADEYQRYMTKALTGGGPVDYGALAGVERMDAAAAEALASGYVEQRLRDAGLVYERFLIHSALAVPCEEYEATGLNMKQAAAYFQLDGKGTLYSWLKNNPAQIVQVDYFVEYSPEYLTRGPQYDDGEKRAYVFVTPNGVQNIVYGVRENAGPAQPQAERTARELGLTQREFLFMVHQLEALTAAGLTDFAVDPGEENAMLEQALDQMSEGQLCRYLTARGRYSNYGTEYAESGLWLTDAQASYASDAETMLRLDFTQSRYGSASWPGLELEGRLAFSLEEQAAHRAAYTPAAYERWEYTREEDGAITAYGVRQGGRVQRYGFRLYRSTDESFTRLNRTVCTGGQSFG